MQKISSLGKNLADCKNVQSCCLSSVRNLLCDIPIWEYRLHQKKFQKAGGVEYVITVTGAVLNMLSPQIGTVTPAARSLINEWFGEDLEDSLKEIGYQAMIANPIPRNKYNQPITILDLYEIAGEFGVDSNGYLDITNFVYLRSKQKFMDVHNTSNLYNVKTIQSDALPVLVNPAMRLWADADEFGIQNLYVDDVIFDPLQKSGRLANMACESGEIVKVVGHAIFNTYTPPLCSIGNYIDDDPEHFVQPFVHHVRNLLRSSGDAKIMLQWCAHIIQRPGEKIRWAPILYSIDQGVGKDTIINFVQEIVGKRYCSTIKPTDIGGNFNEWAQSILIRISEVSDVSEKSSRRKFQEEVKTIISGDDKFVTINEKYGFKHNARNIAHVIITTNNPQDIAVSEEDRRYDVMECATKKAMGIEDIEARKNYFDALYKWYEKGGKENLYAYLLHVDLSDFKATVPRLTEAKEALQQASLDYLYWIQDVIDTIGENQGDLGSNVFRSDTFLAMAKGMCNSLPQWSGPEAFKIATMFRTNIAKFKYQQVKGSSGNGRISVGHGKKTMVYYRNYNVNSLDVDKKDLLEPEQVPDIIELLTPKKESFIHTNPYKIH